MTRPTISIVTVCKNAEESIERAFKSVITCGYGDIEYVVVDGGSTDATLSIINRYRAHIHKYISEPDDGISDALNKAVRMSDGKYHLVLHADDQILPGALAKLAEQASTSGGAVISGSVLVMRNGQLVREFAPQPHKLFQKMSVPHMGSLIAKSAWEAASGYDPRRRIAMDHLLMLRILRRCGLAAFSVVNHPIARYFMGGLSDRQIDRGFLEVRDNLVEEGRSAIAANLIYLKLVAVSKLARSLGRH